MTTSKVSPIKKGQIKLTYKDLKDPQFIPTMQKIATAPLKSPKTAHRILTITKALDPEIKKSQEIFEKTVKTYAELDEKGNFVPLEGRPGTFKIKEGEEEKWKKALEEYEAIECEVDAPKINIEHLEGITLSAMDLRVLDPMINA